MREITTECQVAASPQRVWEVLTDFAAYGSWNPFVKSIEGVPKAGEKLVARIHPPGRRKMTFRPTVRVADAGRELRWLGRLLVPGLFDGEHYFQLEAAPGGGTRFVHGECFRGLLVPLAWSSMEPATRAGFEAMNAALRQRAQAGA